MTLRSPRRDELEGLDAWLDEGLRAGRSGRLAAEYPPLFDASQHGQRQVAWCDGLPVAHALGRCASARVGAASLRIGLVGSVYCDPRHRGRGLAPRCVARVVAQLAAQGAAAVLLWSELDAFYQRQGFVRAGVQWIDVLDRDCLARAAAARAASLPRRAAQRLRIGRPRSGDWPRLEALQAAHRSRVVRTPGALRRLAAAPDCELLVARRADASPARSEVLGWAALGRGDDFVGVVHEHAGDAEARLACLAQWLRDRPALGLLSGPRADPLVEALRAAGSQAHRSALAHVRVLDAPALWRAATADRAALAHLRVEEVEARTGGAIAIRGRAGTTSLGAAAFARLVLGGADTPAPAEALAADAHERAALSRALPWPLFVWGFDSI